MCEHVIDLASVGGWVRNSNLELVTAVRVGMKAVVSTALFHNCLAFLQRANLTAISLFEIDALLELSLQFLFFSEAEGRSTSELLVDLSSPIFVHVNVLIPRSSRNY